MKNRDGYATPLYMRNTIAFHNLLKYNPKEPSSILT